MITGANTLALRGIGIVGIVSLAAQPVWAGSSWLSGTDTRIPGADGVAAVTGAVVAEANSAETVFNITVSLDTNPLGDNAYPEDPGANDDAQNAFERQIEYFADAVYQSTNGRHKIGVVTVFRDYEHWSQADIQWNENCTSNAGPRAFISGFGNDGLNIFMCTNWDGYGGYDWDDVLGYTLAHEWGHYTYGVFDEYIGSCQPSLFSACELGTPTVNDTPSIPSIMNDPYAAAIDNDQEWLEFSTLGVEPFRTFSDGNDENAQARWYGEPAWATMTRDPATDPDYGLPERTRFTTLVAPNIGDYLVTNSLADARSELDVVWGGNPLVPSSDGVWQLALDRSGSMSIESKWENAKLSAGMFLDSLLPGNDAMGVSVFNLDAQQIYPITDIPAFDTTVVPAAKDLLETTVDPDGGTDLETAALHALDQITSFTPGTRISSVLLLTDGRSSVDVTTVANAYTAAGVPLYIYGYGSGVDSALLGNLASSTGGEYYFISGADNIAAAHQAFAATKAAVASNVIVSSSVSPAAGNSTELRPLVLDSAVETATIVVSYVQDGGDMPLRLLAPDETEAADFACEGAAQVSCRAEVSVGASGAGTYLLEIANHAGEDRDVAVLVTADPVQSAQRVEIAVDFDNTDYPENFTLSAIVRKGLPLSGLDVTARVETPGGVLDVRLQDDGLGADAVADDGRYTVDVPYVEDGAYSAVVTASNAAGQAQTSMAGVFPARAVGVAHAAHIPVDVAENFTRAGVKTAMALGVAWDDHSDDRDIPASCTTISDDNTDTAGRIDTEEDIDCFYLGLSSTTDDLVIRLSSLSSGMTPVLRLFNAAGSSRLLTATATDNTNVGGGISLPVPDNVLGASAYVVSVTHSDGAADSGSYRISAGTTLSSDELVENGGGGGGGTSGGALGPWSLVFAALLAMVGLRQRRVLT